VVALLEGRYDVHTNFTYKFQSLDYRNAFRDKSFEKECLKVPELRKIVARIPGATDQGILISSPATDAYSTS